MFYNCAQERSMFNCTRQPFCSFQGISYSIISLHNTQQSAWRPLKAWLNSLINFVAPKRATTLVAHTCPTPSPPRVVRAWPLTRTAYVPLWSVQLKSVWWRCSSQRRCGCLATRAGDEYIGVFTLQREYIVGDFRVEIDEAITNIVKQQMEWF